MKPKLLDLFCGAGGTSMGYYHAGFEVEGVDIKPQPRYPFKFYQANVFEFPLDGYDAYHASPPCQDYSLALRHLSRKVPRLIDAVKNIFEDKNLWVIENVPGAPIPSSPTLFGDYGLLLCGTMFELRKVYRHRLFWTSILIPRPFKDCTHREYAMNPYNTDARKREGIQHNALSHYAKAMGIDWMKGDEIGEAIPPVYTQYIGNYLINYLNKEKV